METRTSDHGFGTHLMKFFVIFSAQYAQEISLIHTVCHHTAIKITIFGRAKNVSINQTHVCLKHFNSPDERAHQSDLHINVYSLIYVLLYSARGK